MRHCSALIADRCNRRCRAVISRAHFAVLFGLCCCSCSAIPELSHKAVLTPHEQAGIGAVAVAELLGTSQLSQNQEQAAATLGVGRRLADASGRDDLEWDFKVVQHPRPIAVALPDGTVLITDSMLARCHSEAELAAALAKEMGCMLAGVYPREVRSPFAGQGYTPLDIGQLTPADESASRWEDIQAADSIGLSLMVRAGYDPAAADKIWPVAAGPIGKDRPAAPGTRRLRSTAHDQSFNKSLAQARVAYRSHPAKLGTGNELAFSPAQPAPTTSPMAHPSTKPVTPVSTALAAPRLQAPATPRSVTSGSGNLAVFSSDGDFLPPNVTSDSSATESWSAPHAADSGTTPSFGVPGEIQQTSFETFSAPTTSGPTLP